MVSRDRKRAAFRDDQQPEKILCREDGSQPNIGSVEKEASTVSPAWPDVG